MKITVLALGALLFEPCLAAGPSTYPALEDASLTRSPAEARESAPGSAAGTTKASDPQKPELEEEEQAIREKYPSWKQDPPLPVAGNSVEEWEQLNREEMEEEEITSEAEEDRQIQEVQAEERRPRPRATSPAARRSRRPVEEAPTAQETSHPPAQPESGPVPSPTPSVTPAPEPTALPSAEGEPLFEEGSVPVAPTSADIRSRKTLGLALHSSLIDLIVPLKYGASLSYVANPTTTIEVEYLRARISGSPFGIDLFDLRDERLSLLGRTFAGNSFNFHYGVTYFRFGARVGAQDFSETAPVPGFDLVQSRGFGFTAGIGNRWMPAEHVAIGVDWVSWSQPLSMKQESSFPDTQVREAVRDDLKLLSYFPRLVFLHLQLGFYF